MRANRRGFTLIEVAIVLAIIAVLAAILTPLVASYLDQARISRAQADLRTIADSIKLYRRDTGRYPIYTSNANYLSALVSDGTHTTFVGPGNTPGDNSGGTWNLAATTATTTLELWINANYSGVSTTNTFPKSAFRGPYVAHIDTDPWGNEYLLNAGNLANTTNHAFVISAGPDGNLETLKTQSATAALSVMNDDLVSVIQ